MKDNATFVALALRQAILNLKTLEREKDIDIVCNHVEAFATQSPEYDLIFMGIGDVLGWMSKSKFDSECNNNRRNHERSKRVAARSQIHMERVSRSAL